MRENTLKNKKVNLIVTILILITALSIVIIVGIHFTKFKNYATEFILRDDVTEIIKFHEYSKHLEGTIGDSNIYVIKGSENTVALMSKEKNNELTTLELINNERVSGVKDSAQYKAGQKTLSNIQEEANLSNLLLKLKNKEIDVAIISFKEASDAVKNDSNFVISSLEIEKVPSILIIGGTHPNEPAGQLASTVFLENAVVERGILYVITELNKSAYTYTQPQEATSEYYHLKTINGTTRTFKYGSRSTNNVLQFPTPDLYTHSSGQKLSSSEVRNINRAYPGSESGNYTEQLAYAITNFVNSKDITMVIDLHEASPEYLTIDACVYHQDASDIIAKSRSRYFRYLNEDGMSTKLDISYDESPMNMHGLTHRELGDYTNAYVLLFETSNASQGKLRGAFSEDLITYYTKDKFYEAAVKYDEEHNTSLIYGNPVSIDERVARHCLSVISVINGFNSLTEDGGITRTVKVTERDNEGVGGVAVGKFLISGIPEYQNIISNGVGYYLLDSKR